MTMPDTQTLITLGGALFGSGFVWRAVRWLRAQWKDGKALVAEVREGLAMLSPLDARVQAIEQQLGPNGGKSAGAKLDRVHDMTRRIDARLSATMNVIATAVFDADADGMFVGVNRAFEVLTGYSNAEVTGRGWLSAVHPDDRGRVAEDWVRATKDKRIFECDFRIRHRAGVVFVRVHGEAKPTCDEDDNCIGWMGAFHEQPEPSRLETRSV